MILLQRTATRSCYSMLDLPKTELSPDQILEIMRNHNKYAQNKNLYVQFEDQTVPVDLVEFATIANFVCIHHNNIIEKDNYVSKRF